MSSKPHHHLALALLIAGGLSLYFAFAFGLEWRWLSAALILICALIGTSAGWFARRRLWVTGLSTMILRCALFIGLRGAVT